MRCHSWEMTENSLFQTFSWCRDRDLLQVSTVPGFESSLSHSVQGSSPAFLTVSRVRVQPISQCLGFDSSLSHSVQGSSPAYFTVSRVRFHPISLCPGFESSLSHSVQGSSPAYLTVTLRNGRVHGVTVWRTQNDLMWIRILLFTLMLLRNPNFTY